MARFAHVDQTSPTTQARRVGVAVLAALFLAISLALTLGGNPGQGTDVAGKSWWRIVPPTASETATATTKAVSKVITVDGKSWA